MNTNYKASLPRKVYLSGADCFHLVLDKHARKHGAGGNVMRKVFYFNKALSADKVIAILQGSPVIYWLCNITLKPGNLFGIPYWKYSDMGRNILLHHHKEDIEKAIPQKILERDINVHAERFIEADLVSYPSGCCAFILSWNHILLDAKGTNLLFEHLDMMAANRETRLDTYFPAKQKGTGMLAYIRNMYKVKSFIQHSSRKPVSSIATVNCKSSAGIVKYRNIHFNSTESEKINSNAVQTGSRFGPTLFFIACCAKVIYHYNKKNNKKGDIWLPVPYDGRMKGATGPLISNCVSFLFYRLPESALTDIHLTVKSLSAQMTAQVKDNIPKRYSMFLNMMRHVPLWLYYFLISRTGEGTFASFLYTSTGDNFKELKSLFGEPLSGLALIPALTYPPGFTFVFMKHESGLSIEIAYSPEVIDGNDLLLIEQNLRDTLFFEY